MRTSSHQLLNKGSLYGRVAPRLHKITGLLSKAIEEVQQSSLRTTLNSQAPSSKRKSNESSEC